MPQIKSLQRPAKGCQSHDETFDKSQFVSYGKTRKRYLNVKSKYMNNASKSSIVVPRHHTTKEFLVNRKCIWLKKEKSRLAKFNDPQVLRVALLSPIEFAYLNMIESNDGRLDKAASAFGYLVKIDDERIKQLWESAMMIVPSIRKNTQLLTLAKCALADGNPEWPLALLRAAFVFIGDGQHSQWLWATELFLLAAMSQVVNVGGLDEATCLFVIGWFYGQTGTTDSMHDTLPLSVQFLEESRRVADNHRLDWHLPVDVLHAIECTNISGAMNDIGNSVWAIACFFEHEVLMKAAQKLDPDRALRTIQVAHQLATELSNVGLNRRYLATVSYELGIRYAAVGCYDQARIAFGECAAFATGLDSGLDLDALLEAAQMYPEPPNDNVLEWIVNNSLNRCNVRVLVKAMAARARLSTDNGNSNEAYSRYLIAHRLATIDADALDMNTIDSIRLFAAINQTLTFWKFNFQSLSERAFNLLADPLIWTTDRPSLIIRNCLDGCIYMNADRFQNAIIENQAMRVRIQLKKLDESRKWDNSLGTNLLLANSTMLPKVVNESLAALFDNGDDWSRKLLRSKMKDSSSMRRRIPGILMCGKQFSLDSRMDIVQGMIPTLSKMEISTSYSSYSSYSSDSSEDQNSDNKNNESDGK